MNDIAKPSQYTRQAAQYKAVKAISAMELLGEMHVVVIEHKGERYELRLTRNDKLILTK
ncbi:MAG: hemin uptake protein HemP [Gallionellaceae bacterium]|nr:hemin uptake protein HemP [Gallionellaceae bacterium]